MTLTTVLADQAAACGALGSPFMARLLGLLAGATGHSGTVMARLRDWPGDGGRQRDVVALRLAAGLHALVLTRRDRRLAAAYPPHDVTDAELLDAALAALETHASLVHGYLDTAPQTNEVRRSAAILPVLSGLSIGFGLPVGMLELGASAGLNLRADRYALEVWENIIGDARSKVRLRPEWRGDAPRPANIRIAFRHGCDLAPADSADTETRTRLLSYLWADQPERLARTRAAFALAAGHPAPIDRADAGAWIAGKLARRPGTTRLIFHTVAWQYFPEATRARVTAAIDAAGKRATADSPLAWFAMETDGQQDGAALRLRLWPGDEDHDLGRADFHGRWIDWRAGWTCTPAGR